MCYLEFIGLASLTSANLKTLTEKLSLLMKQYTKDDFTEDINKRS